MRKGTALIALGRVRSGCLVSATAVPTSSAPTKAKRAIWKEPKKPVTPWVKMPLPEGPGWSHRWAREAVVPSGLVKLKATMSAPTIMRATIATILMTANQNSISPKFFTEGRFSSSSAVMTTSAGMNLGMPGSQYCT